MFISIERVLILAVLSMTILTFGKGSDGETVIVVAVTQSTFDPFVLNFDEG